MEIEWILIAAGVVIFIAMLAQRRVLQKRLSENRSVLAGVKFQDDIPAEVRQDLKKGDAKRRWNI